MTVDIAEGDTRKLMRAMSPESVQCVVTSPPYWGLREYGGAPLVWGQTCCEHPHQWGAVERAPWANALPSAKSVTRRNTAFHASASPTAGQWCEHVHEWETIVKPAANGIVNSAMQGETMNSSSASRKPTTSGRCECGAWLGSLGLEPTMQLYIEHMVEVCREIRRVMRKDGTFWLVLGDSYAQYTERGRHDANEGADVVNSPKWQGKAARSWRGLPAGTKRKDLLLLPARVAIALQEDGWWVRSEIAWCKRSHLPEPAFDRPVSAWEHVFLLTKQGARYYYDRDAVREPSAQDKHNKKYAKPYATFDTNASGKQPNNVNSAGIHSRPGSGGHNMQNYWILGPEPFAEAHFAVMPTEIARRAIAAGTKPGDTVLDPFLGSGTTALVADQMGRNAVGHELNPEYAEIARRRLFGALFADLATLNAGEVA